MRYQSLFAEKLGLCRELACLKNRNEFCSLVVYVPSYSIYNFVKGSQDAELEINVDWII
jgi:hypothetical protein